MAMMRPAPIRATGTPGDRPPGFPCFHCGDQVRTERAVLVEWEGGQRTYEPCCDECPEKALRRFHPEMFDEVV